MASPTAVELTKSVALMRDYECCRDHGGCGHTWKDLRTPENMREVTCVLCGTHGREQLFHEKLGRRVHRIQIVFPDGIPHMITDISGQDGRTNQGVDMRHTLSTVKEITSRSQLPDALKREREAMFDRTQGEHVRNVPFKLDPSDPESPVVWEKETVVHAGFDPGELHPVETIHETANRPRSAFDPGRSLEDSENDLELRVGPPNMGMDFIPWEEVEQVSNQAFKKGLR